MLDIPAFQQATTKWQVLIVVAYRQLELATELRINQLKRLWNSFHLSPRAPILAMAHRYKSNKLLSRILQGHDLSEE
jgi:hypothetical protein